LAISWRKRSQESKIQKFKADLIIYCGSAIISAVDFLLNIIIKKIVQFEKPNTYTREQLAMARKLWKLQFALNALIPLIYSLTIVNFFGVGGLIDIINGILITNIWLTPLVGLFGDIFWYIKLMNRNKVETFVLTGAGGPYTQKEANQIF
jgi:hypothetical protein